MQNLSLETIPIQNVSLILLSLVSVYSVQTWRWSQCPKISVPNCCTGWPIKKGQINEEWRLAFGPFLPPCRIALFSLLLKYGATIFLKNVWITIVLIHYFYFSSVFKTKLVTSSVISLFHLGCEILVAIRDDRINGCRNVFFKIRAFVSVPERWWLDSHWAVFVSVHWNSWVCRWVHDRTIHF